MARERRTIRSQVRDRRPDRRPTRVRNISAEAASHQGLQSMESKSPVEQWLQEERVGEEVRLRPGASDDRPVSSCILKSGILRYGPGID